MKATSLVLTLITLSASGQELPKAIDIGPDHRVWESIEEVITEEGSFLVTNRVEQVETGLNFQGADGTWLSASPRLEVAQDGSTASARNLQFQVTFAPSALADQVFDVVLPDGQRLAGRVLGIGYVDENGQSVIIAEPVEVTGKITGPEGNEVVFESAFAGGIEADLIYQVSRGGLSQNVLLKSQIPPPTDFELSDKAVLTLFTEFTAHPAIDHSVQSTPQDAPAKAALSDEAIGLGSMQFRTGRAFMIGKEGSDLAVSKSITVIENRTLLLEKLPWVKVDAQLKALPVAKEGQAQAARLKSRTLQAALRERPKAGQASFAKPKREGVAALSSLLSGTGLLWDYELALSTSSKTWIADRTYWLSGPVFVTNSVAEGGAIIKMTNGAKLTIAGPSVWPKDFRPLVITSIGDTNHGEKIGTNTTAGGFIGDVALEFASSQTTSFVQNVRILNAKKGVSFAAGTQHTLRHVQMVNVGVGVEAASGVAYRVQNALFHGVLTNFMGSGSTAHVSHLTANTADWLGYNNQVTVNLTNSLIVAVANGVSTTTNAVTRVATTNGVFQAVGAGYAYPSAGYVLTGTNAIDSGLAADLAQRTVYPPVILTNHFTSNTTLSAQAARDTSSFWRGFHYVPLDYAWTALHLTNATLTLTNGVALGFYGDRGLTLQNAAKVVSYGSPTKPVRWTYFNSVHEQPLAWGTPTSFSFLRVGSLSTIPQVTMRFSDVSVMANLSGKRTFISDSSATLAIRDSWLRSVMISSFGATATTVIGLTNNLIHRGELSAQQYDTTTLFGLVFQCRNNLLIGNSWNVAYGAPTYGAWGIHDNFFVGCSMTITEANSMVNPLPNSNNGYFGTTLLPSGSNNVLVTTLDWVSGPFSDYYYPKEAYGQSLATLIDRGSGLAKDVGLYHFTTLTDSSREGTGVNDIGLHWVASPDGVSPYDDDGDGLYSAMEDSNGDGLQSSGETGWYPPTLILTNSPPSYFVSSPAVALDPTALIDDIDALDYAGAQLTADLVYTVKPTEDRLEIIGGTQLGVNGASLSFQGTPFASYQSLSNGTKLVITFTNTSAASLLAARTLLRSIGYRNLSVTPDFMHRTARFQFQDGYGTNAPLAYKAIQIGCSPKLDVVFLIDRTGTLSPTDFTDALGAAKTMLDHLDLSKDQVSVLSFCEGISNHLVGGFSTNKTTLLSAISSIVQTNGVCTTTWVDNSINQAQLQILDLYRRTNVAQPLILLISDGIDYAGSPTTGSTSAKTKGTRILSFGVGYVNIPYLKTEASCEADYYSGSDSNALAAALFNVAGQLCRGNNTAPTVTLTSPTNNASYAVPAQIELRAEATDVGGRVTKVEFYQAGTKIGEDLWPPYSAFFGTSTPGAYTFSAVATDDTGLRVSSSAVTVTVSGGGSRTYTRNVDFASGSLLNVNFDEVRDQLTLNRKITPFPFVSVACTTTGSLVRIDANTGEILGEYYTAPATLSRSPAAVAVDRLGNTWVGNMGEDSGGNGSVTCIGLVVGGTRGYLTNGSFVPNPLGEYLKPPFLYNTCIDRNQDGYIRTSYGRGHRLSWDSGNTSSDEAVLCFVRTGPVFVEGLAIDPSGDVWACGKLFSVANGTASFQKLYGSANLSTIGTPVAGASFTTTAGGANAVVDANDVLWSSSELLECVAGAGGIHWGSEGLLRAAPGGGTNWTTPIIQRLGDTTGNTTRTNGNAGLALDPKTGNLWFAQTHEGYLFRILPSGASSNPSWKLTYSAQFANACGIAVDQIDNVWLAYNTKSCEGGADDPSALGHFLTDGTYVGRVPLCNGSGGTGVSIDHNGKVWVITQDVGTRGAFRINPNTGPKMLNNQLDESGVPVGSVDRIVDLAPSPTDMSVGDMTGYAAIGITAPSGVWSTLHHSGLSNSTWGTITWHPTQQPSNTTVAVQVRAHNDRLAINTNAWVSVVNGTSLSPSLTGQWLEFRVTFSREFSTTNRPVLYDLTVTSSNQVPVDVQVPAAFAKDDHFSLFQNQVNVVLPVLANDTDPSGGSLGIADGSSPSSGSLTNTGTTLIYTPRTNFFGLDRFTYSVTNSGGVKSWGLVQLMVAELRITSTNPPIANNDYHTVRGGIPSAINVLSNDSNYVSIVHFTDGKHGKVELANAEASHCAGTNLLYTPHAYFVGYDDFTYTLVNASGTLRSATVRVHVTGDPVEELSCGSVIAGSITADDQSDVAHTGRGADYFTLLVSAPINLRIAVASESGSALQVTNIYEPNGTPISPSGDGTFALGEIGTHLIELANSTFPFPYTLSLICVETGSIPNVRLLAGAMPLTNNCTLNFGICDPARSYVMPCSLMNTGKTDLNILTYSQTGNFDLAPSPSLPGSVAPGEAFPFKLRFSPGGTVGLHSGSVTIETDDPNLGSFVINLTGHAFTNRPTLVMNSPTNGSAMFQIPSSIPLQASMLSYAGSITDVSFITSHIKILEDVGEDPAESWAISGLGTRLIASGVVAATNFWTNLWSYAGEDNYQLVAVATTSSGIKGVNGQGQSVDVVTSGPDKNRALTARDDFYVIAANSSNNTLKVLSNDQDPDQDTLRILSFTGPGFGTVVQNGPEFLYTPTANVIGTNSFSYEVTDDHGHRARAIVTLAVTPLVVPSITLTNPVSGSQFTLPQTLTLAVSTSGPVQRVEFFVDGEKIGETNGYSVVWADGTPGVHSIWAVASASNGLQASSDTALVTLFPKPGNRLPVALISNLTSTNDSGVTPGISLPMPPWVREGLLDVRGTAKDPDAGDSVAYKIRVLSMKGEILKTFSFSGTKPGTNDLLGTLDLTSLQNGPYTIALEVRDGSDSAEDTRQILLDTQLKLGQFTFSEEDLVIPVSGYPLTVVRTYDSLNPNQGDFGYSWTYAINDVQLEINEVRQIAKELEFSSPEETFVESGDTFSMRVGGGRDVTLTLPDGRRATYRFELKKFQASSPCPDCYEAIWTPPPGVYATLRTPTTANGVNMTADNAINPYGPGYATWGQGGAHTPWENYDIPKFILTTPDGTEYSLERDSANSHDHYFTFDENFNMVYVEPKGKARLRLVKQRSGDLISIADNRIDHYNATNGLTRSLVFIRDSLGRISEIRDPSSGSDGLPAVRYEYDFASGNLARVLKLVDRALGIYQTNSYFYTNTTFPHYLTSVVDARGTNVARQMYDSTGKLTSLIDAEGRTTSFIHDLTGKTEKVVNRLGITNSFSFDLQGNILASTNAWGTPQARTDVFGYDSQGNKLVETNGFGTGLATWSFYGYNTNGLVLATTNALGFTNGFQFNGYGQLELAWDAKGNVATNVYLSNGNLQQTRSAYGRITSYTYDGANRLLMETNPLSTVTKNVYDALGNVTNTQTLKGSQVQAETQFRFDSNGNRTNQLVRRTPAGGTTPQWLSTSWVYDALNRVIMTIDPDGYTNLVYYGISGKVEATTNKLGQVTRHEYGPRGLLSKTTWPDNSFETYAYDAEGRRTNVTDRAGRSTGYQFDAAGRLTNTVFADGTSTKTFYDQLGRVKHTLDANGVTNVAYGYDLLGRQTSVTNGWGLSGVQAVSGSLFDENGNLTRTTDPLGNATDYSYDALNQRYQTDFPATVAGGARANIRVRFDAAGQKVAETNEAGVVTLYGFDALGRMTSVTNALGATEQTLTKYQFDEVGNMTNQVDALNRSTSFSYDVMNRRTSRRLPLGQLETFSYDPEGNMRQHLDFNGFVMTNQFDSLNRLISQHATNTILQRIGYTTSGLRAGVTNWPGASGWEYAETFTYDSRDRLKTNQNSVGKLLYTYDNNGNLTSLKSGTANGVDLTYQYDGLNRLTNVVDNRLTGTNNTSYRLDGNGNLQTLKYPNGVTNLWQYDTRNRLTNELCKINGTIIGSYFYKLAVTGHRTNLDETVNGTSRGYGWGYDSLYRLKAESLSGGSTGTNGYTFDKVGNRLTRVTSVSGLTNQTFTYTSNDGLNTAEAYDANGNATTSFGSVLQYDHLNRLTNAGGTVVQSYSASGNRVKKIAGGSTTIYLVSDLNPTGYAQVVEELTVSGGSTNLSCNYTWGLGLISQRVASSGTNYFYGLDGHGSVRCVMNAVGTVVNTYTYDAWGILIASSVAVSNNYLYAGEQWDPDLNLYYLRARFQRPQAGRFIKMDSFEGNPSDPLSLHKYLFCHDDPVTRVDPSGQTSVITVAVTVGTIAAVVILTYNHFSAKRAVNAPADKGFAYARTLTYFGLFSYTLTGIHYDRLGPAGKWMVDFHEKQHRDGDHNEATVSWKQKELTETILISGLYAGGRSLTEQDVQDIVTLWYAVSEAYHDNIESQKAGEDLLDRLKKKGISETRLKELKLRSRIDYLK